MTTPANKVDDEPLPGEDAQEMHDRLLEERGRRKSNGGLLDAMRRAHPGASDERLLQVAEDAGFCMTDEQVRQQEEERAARLAKRKSRRVDPPQSEQ